jgi:hypothetical protein
MNKTYVADVIQLNGDTVLELSKEFCQEQDWQEGDVISWNVKGDVVTMTNLDAEERKEEMEFYLVETISVHRIRYVVRAKESEQAKNKVLDNLDDVEVLKEFSQKHLQEVVSYTRKITREEVIELCDEDNDYLKSWTDDEKIQRLVC